MFPRYVPLPIATAYRSGVRSQCFSAVSLSLDLVGFTALCEALLPLGRGGGEALATELETIFAPMVDAVEFHGGFITDYAGDALTAIFPIEAHLHVGNAVGSAICAAKKSLRWLDENGMRTTQVGSFKITARVGIGFGDAKFRIVEYLSNKTGVGNDRLGFYFYGGAIETCSLTQASASHGVVKIAEGTPKSKKAVSGRQPEYPVFNSDDMRNFLPDILVEREPRGEARWVAPVYGRFPEPLNDAELDGIFSILCEGEASFGGFLSGLHYDAKGWGFLMLFGAPEAHEDDVQRAMEFAIYTRKRIGDEIGCKLKLGINAGEAYAGLTGGAGRVQYTCLGDSINLSERLSGLAQNGQILCSQSVVRKTAQYKFKNIGQYSVKGKAESLPVFQPMGLRQLDAGIPFDGELCGRHGEMSRLEEFVQPVLSGHFGGIVRIAGNPGTGKSRILFELKKGLENHEAEIRWIYLVCDPINRNALNVLLYLLKMRFPYAEFGDREKWKHRFKWAIEEYVRNPKISNENRKELLRTYSILGGYLGYRWQDSLFETLDPRLRKENFLYAMKAFVKAEAEIAPTIVAIEDAHFIDSGSEEWLEILTRNVENIPFIVITTERPDEEGNIGKLSLDDTVPVSVLELENLDSNGLRELINTQLGFPADEKLYGYIRDKSEGNPFFAEQFCRHLLDRNAVEKRDGNISLVFAPEQLPTDAEAMLIARIDAMGARVKDLLQKASILGARFATRILKKMFEPQVDIYPFLLEAEQCGAILPEDTVELSELFYMFRSALIREASYGMQLPGARSKLHKLALELYEMLFPEEQRGPHYIDMSRHAKNAGEIQKYTQLLACAADYAKETYSNKQALEMYDILIEQDLPAQEKANILVNKQIVLLLIGKSSEALTLCERALDISRAIGNEKLEGDVLHYIGGIHKILGEYRESMEYYNEALGKRRKIADRKGEGSTLGNMGNAYKDMGEYDKAMDYYEEALAIFREIGDARSEAIGYNNMGLIYKNEHKYEKAMEYYRKSLEIRRRINDKRGEAITLNNMGAIYSKLEEYEKAIRLCNSSLEMRREVGDRRGVAITLGNIGNIYMERRKYGKAIVYYTDVVAICRELGDRKHEAEALFDLAKIRLTAKEKKFNDKKEGQKCLQKAYILFKNLNTPAVDVVKKLAEKYKIELKN